MTLGLHLSSQTLFHADADHSVSNKLLEAHANTANRNQMSWRPLRLSTNQDCDSSRKALPWWRLVCISHLKLRFMPTQTTQTCSLKPLLFQADDSMPVHVLRNRCWIFMLLRTKKARVYTQISDVVKAVTAFHKSRLWFEPKSTAMMTLLSQSTAEFVFLSFHATIHKTTARQFVLPMFVPASIAEHGYYLVLSCFSFTLLPPRTRKNSFDYLSFPHWSTRTDIQDAYTYIGN